MALVYHRVDDPLIYPFLTKGGTPVISPEELEGELMILHGYGARFLTLADLRKGIFPASDEFGVIVTFDDGFRDNYTIGVEVLDSVGIKGVFFQCSAMIDSNRLIPEHALYWYSDQKETAPALLKFAHGANWSDAIKLELDDLPAMVGRWMRELPAQEMRDRLEKLRQRFPMEEPATKIYPTTKDVQRVSRSGHEIGSHGNFHLYRDTLNAVEFENELSESCDRIKNVIGSHPLAFSYPFNRYLTGDREICERYFSQTMTVDGKYIERDYDSHSMARFTWPGPARNSLRRRRWLLTGRI